MALIIEDGTEVVGANTFVDVADYVGYWDDRFDETASDKTSQAKISASLIKATAYMGYTFRDRWKGARVTSTQDLDWPRKNVFLEDTGVKVEIDNATIPQEVKDAELELAKIAVDDLDLAPALDRGGQLESFKVGPLEIKYFGRAVPQKVFVKVNAILRPLLNPNALLLQRSA